MKNSRNTSWDKVAGWYDKHVSEVSDYHKEVIIPQVMSMLDPKSGEKMLDVGCGQGILCRKLAEKGAVVTGIDASKKLISLARNKSGSGRNISYKIADATRMECVESDSFNAAVSILAIQNMDPLDAVAKETARVVKKHGRLVWVLNHPCFRIPRQSGWGHDEKRKIQYRRIDRYISPLKIPIQMHPGMAPDVYTWTFHRSLTEYFRELFNNGFVVNKLEEWVSHRKSLPGKTAKMEDRAREEIPMFLAIGAIKL